MQDYAFYTLDHEGYVTRWNEGAERLKGYEASEILGAHLSEFFIEEDRQAGDPDQLIEAAKTDGSVTDEGWRLQKDGSRFWAHVTLSASFDEAGTLRGFGEMIQELPKQPKTH
jgi:PAS domain S-box-containing protein